MKKPDVPKDEEGRLERLRALGILDTPPEEAFDDVVQLASRLLRVPIALVSLVDADRQWFKARVGLDAPQTPRDVSFCGHAVAAGELLVVPDAHEDERFADNPLVVGDPNVRFYAGAPLTTSDGHSLGTLCVIDSEARWPSEDDLETLELLAKQLVAQLEIRRREAQASFFTKTLDLLCITGFDGYFKLVNPAWTLTLGWTVEELQAVPFTDFVHEDDREMTAAEAGKLAAGEHLTVSFINRFRCRDGRYRWLSWTAAPDPNGELIHAVGRDITERREVEKMKDEFVAMISHELRTPLTSIRGSLRLLEGGLAGPLPEKASELVGIASSNTDRLMRLVNDILDIEKIEAGMMELHLAPHAPEDLVNRAVQEMLGLAADAGVALSAEGQSHADVNVDGDRILQVLTNLLSNAIKFSPQGASVTLSTEQRGSNVRFCVRDQGPGLEPAEQLEVFGKFHQVDSSDTRSQGGTGLGLAICKAIVAQHGGEIGVDSDPGQGCVFWLEL